MHKKPIPGFTAQHKPAKISAGSGTGSPVKTVSSQPLVGKLNAGNGTSPMGSGTKPSKV